MKFTEVISKKGSALFIMMVGLLGLVDRLLLVNTFHFELSDVDQLIQWHAAQDYSNGIFHEPYFYGQDYGPMAEAFLAAPLVMLGLHSQFALPVISMLLSLLPF